jgi:hypothetical protein
MHEGVTTASKKKRSGGTGPETPMTRRLISIFGLVCLYHKQNRYVAQVQSESIDMKLAVTVSRWETSRRDKAPRPCSLPTWGSRRVTVNTMY